MGDDKAALLRQDRTFHKLKMPKNKGKGGKNRRRGKNENDQIKRELELKEEGQEYAQVTKIVGQSRAQCKCFDGKERLCHIRGKMRKKVWIGVGDIVLLGLRDFQDEKADIIHKYKPEEARRLKAQGHIPDNIQIDADNVVTGGDVVFKDVDDLNDREDNIGEIFSVKNQPKQEYGQLPSDYDFSSNEDSDSGAEEEESDESFYEPSKIFSKASNQKADFQIESI